jgi:uncharacterized protein
MAESFSTSNLAMPSQARLLPIGPHHRASLLALNNAHARETSDLDGPGLQALLDKAFYAQAVEAKASIAPMLAFMIAFDQDADYASLNFLWFRQRYQRFVYVDRIVVASSARGLGLAKQLYQGFFTAARQEGHTLATCEVNSHPPNPASDRFHAVLGFSVAGEAALYGQGKQVRYMIRPL